MTAIFSCKVVKDVTQFGAVENVFGTNLEQVLILVHNFGTSLPQFAPFIALYSILSIHLAPFSKRVWHN